MDFRAEQIKTIQGAAPVHPAIELWNSDSTEAEHCVAKVELTDEDEISLRAHRAEGEPAFYMTRNAALEIARQLTAAALNF